MDGSELIAEERLRQVQAEGWTEAHDAGHTQGQLAWAAAVLAAPEQVYRYAEGRGGYHFIDPWPTEWTPNANRGEPGQIPWRRPACDRLRELAKAGALIAAEIDRLLAEGYGDPT